MDIMGNGNIFNVSRGRRKSCTIFLRHSGNKTLLQTTLKKSFNSLPQYVTLTLVAVDSRPAAMADTFERFCTITVFTSSSRSALVAERTFPTAATSGDSRKKQVGKHSGDVKAYSDSD